jgi:hypothetical protein
LLEQQKGPTVREDSILIAVHCEEMHVGYSRQGFIQKAPVPYHLSPNDDDNNNDDK